MEVDIMETTTVQTEKIPGFIDLIRIMILIALFGLMICFESSAQVNTKTYDNPLQSIAVEEIIQLIEMLDSIESEKGSEINDQAIIDHQLLAEDIEEDMLPESWMTGNDPGRTNSSGNMTVNIHTDIQPEILMYNPLTWKK